MFSKLALGHKDFAALITKSVDNPSCGRDFRSKLVETLTDEDKSAAATTKPESSSPKPFSQHTEASPDVTDNVSRVATIITVDVVQDLLAQDTVARQTGGRTVDLLLRYVVKEVSSEHKRQVVVIEAIRLQLCFHEDRTVSVPAREALQKLLSNLNCIYVFGVNSGVATSDNVHWRTAVLDPGRH